MVQTDGRLDKIYALLKEHPEGRTKKEIADYMGMKTQNVPMYIASLTMLYPLSEEVLPWGKYGQTNYFLMKWED